MSIAAEFHKTPPPAAPRAPSVPLAIAGTLRARIVTGIYNYGEKIPTERKMAIAFGTSRATLREALRLLEQSGLIQRKVGSGTYVIYQPADDGGQSSEDVAETTSPLELVDARTAIEPHMVRLAVLSVTSKDIAGLEEALAGMEAAGIDAERFTYWDRIFHQRIADSTRNPLIAALYRQINHVRGHTQWRTIKSAVLTSERINHYNQLHRAIYEAMRAHDAETAAHIIEAHMSEARNDLLRGGAR